MIARAPEGPLVRLSLCNPPANLLSLDVMHLVQAELDAARDNEDVRVIVIAAVGTMFSAGHDLRELTQHRSDGDGGRAFFERSFAICSRLMQSIATHPKPVIAEVDGVATAAGCQLVASCDLAVASERSKFGVNGIDVGLFCSTPAVALTRSISRKRAMEMLLTGAMIDARTALEFGLVNRVVASEQLSREVGALGARIARKSSLAVKLGKKALNDQAGLGLAEAYDCASRAMVENMLAADAREGISAFLDKRQPVWRDD